MESPNVLRSISTTKWLRSRHIRTSSVSYLHSQQDYSMLQDVSVVYRHFASKDGLDFRRFMGIFRYASIPLAQQDVRKLFELFRSVLPVSERQFRETVTGPVFGKKFAIMINALRRPNLRTFLPSDVNSFMNLVANKVNEQKIEGEVMTVRITQGHPTGEHLQKLSEILELVKNHRIEMPACSLPTPPSRKNIYLDEVKQKLKMIDVLEESGSKSPQRSPSHRRAKSLKMPFLI